ncbi:unnamed protein product [Cercospora beticola]|nr:unnamed protein product [Cercospora beticola]
MLPSFYEPSMEQQELASKNDELRTRFRGWGSTPQVHCLCQRFSCPGNCIDSSALSEGDSTRNMQRPEAQPLRMFFGDRQTGLKRLPNRYARTNPQDYATQMRVYRYETDMTGGGLSKEKFRRWKDEGGNS